MLLNPLLQKSLELVYADVCITKNGSQSASGDCTAAGNLLAEVWDSCCDRHRQTGDEQGFAFNRNGLAIFLHTFDVERYGFGDVILCFLDSGSESMATRQRRYIGVKRILVRLYDDSELVNRHLHTLRKATSPGIVAIELLS
jgi:hypothetical protein